MHTQDAFSAVRSHLGVAVDALLLSTLVLGKGPHNKTGFAYSAILPDQQKLYLPIQCSDYRHVPLCLTFYMVLGIRTGVFMLVPHVLTEAKHHQLKSKCSLDYS